MKKWFRIAIIPLFLITSCNKKFIELDAEYVRLNSDFNITNFSEISVLKYNYDVASEKYNIEKIDEHYDYFVDFFKEDINNCDYYFLVKPKGKDDGTFNNFHKQVRVNFDQLGYNYFGFIGKGQILENFSYYNGNEFEEINKSFLVPFEFKNVLTFTKESQKLLNKYEALNYYIDLKK